MHIKFGVYLFSRRRVPQYGRNLITTEVFLHIANKIIIVK